MDTNGGNGPVNHLWGYTGSTAEGLAFVKTMWDPCPPGYRVMQYDVFMTARICYTEEYDDIYLPDYEQDESYYEYGLMLSPGESSGGTIRNGFSTVWESGPLVLDSDVWLPNAGRIDNNGGYSLEESCGYLSTSTPMGGKTCREMLWEKNGYSYRRNYYYSIQERNSDAYTANGRPVRCQME